ncbi:MAG: biliverdin-producing heme oxygenase [Proteobacteria bacterium]|nr:biliverdin-producing heme oxygenase [Pseudomonadota bacterium]
MPHASATAPRSADRPAGALAALRAATWPCHQRLERRLEVKRRFGERAAYRRHLEQMWGFCAGLECGDAPTVGARVLPDYERRRKLPLLERDLVALGADAGGLAGLPRCGALERCGDAAVFLGRVYVLEGATLGGRTLLPLVERQLGFSAGHGAAFLASYGEDVEAMWRCFGAAVEAGCATPEQRSRAAAAACEAFEVLEHWLCGGAS